MPVGACSPQREEAEENPQPERVGPQLGLGRWWSRIRRVFRSASATLDVLWVSQNPVSGRGCYLGMGVVERHEIEGFPMSTTVMASADSTSKAGLFGILQSCF